MKAAHAFFVIHPLKNLLFGIDPAHTHSVPEYVLPPVYE